MDWNVIGKIYLDGLGLVEGGVSIKEDKIFKVGKTSNLPRASKIFRREGTVILPGLIDSHVHLRGLNLTYKEDFYTGTCSAAIGGFATVLDMPNTIPPTDSPERLRNKVKEASKDIVVDVGFHVYPPKKLGELHEMIGMGVASVKYYMPELKDVSMLKPISNICERAGVPITVHPESITQVEKAFEKFGEVNSLEAFLKIHSTKAEAQGVREVLDSVNSTSAVHFCHISSKEALHLIKNAKSKGANCTIEVTPHHLMLNCKDLIRLGSIGLMLPPLRNERDLNALWKGVADKRIDTIGSDHAPHTLEEKLREDIWNVPPGIPGLETTLPVLTTLLNKGRIKLSELVKMMAERPAEIFNLKGKGFIAKGFQGDLTVVDLKSEQIVDPENFKSKAKYSPFSGFKCKGKSIATFVGGTLTAVDGEIKTSPKSGKVIKICRVRENFC